MGEVDRLAVVRHLEGAGVRPDVAAQYADLFVEYQTAAAHIREHGAIVAHPRTNNPMPNPYLEVRDRARAGLAALNVRQAAALWREGGG